MSPMSIFESQTRKTLTLLLQHTLSSTSPNTTTNNNNLPLPYLQPHSLLSAPPIPPPRRFLSTLLPQDVWSGRISSLKWMYANTCPNVSDSKKDSAFSGQEGMTEGSSASKPKGSSGIWTNILIAAHFLAYGEYDAKKVTHGQLKTQGAQMNYRIAQWRSLVKTSFVHANIPHLLINCYGLYVFGHPVESSSGHFRFLAVYLTSAIAGSAMSCRFRTGISAGSSGAICGLVGAQAVYRMRHKEDQATKGLQTFAYLIALNMLIRVGLRCKSIDNWAHLGGFLGGAAASWILGPR